MADNQPDSRHIESVFAVLNRKSDSFQRRKGKRTALISCIVMWLCTLCAYTHTIQVWGYCIVYSCTGHSTTFFDVNESQPHTFFIYIIALFGVGGQKKQIQL